MARNSGVEGMGRGALLMGYGRFVGRVGTLAVALGIGLAGPAVAAADPADENSTGDSRADTTSAESGSEAGPRQAESEAAESEAESDSDSEADSETDDGEADGDLDDAESATDPTANSEESDADTEESDVADDAAPPADAKDDTVLEADDDLGESEPDSGHGAPTPRTGDRAVHSRSVGADAAEVTRAAAAGSPAVADTTASRTAAPKPAAPSPVSDGDAVAVSVFSAAPAVPATTTRATVAQPGLAEMVSKFLGILGIGPSATGDNVPLPAFEFVTAVFGAVRREMDRLFSNNGPSAALTSIAETAPGVITGTLTASDPEGDRLLYTLVQAPTRGTVEIDSSGNFIYTAHPHLAAEGDDSFVIQVRDAGFHLISVSPTKTRVPVSVTVAANASTAQGDSQATFSRLMAAAVTTTGTIHPVTTSGPDIVGFDPAKDKLDLGDVSVHNFIVVDTPEGVGFRNPWSGETAVVQGVSLGQLTADSFTPIINDHLRQDLSGALAWEQGVTPKPNTVYARSHEVGQIDRVAFNPATDVVDFRYFGTREQVYMADTPEGVVISNAGTGQALVLQGVTVDKLTARNFVFHSAQVREDRVHLQLGIGVVPDSQVLPQGVPVAGTNTWPTAAGNGTPPSGQTGTTTTISWQHGTHTTLAFDPAKDKLDFGWFKATEFDVTELNGSTRIAITNNNQSYTLNGVAIGELQTSNIVALDSSTRTKWSNLIYSAVPPVSQPTLSVSDAAKAEGNSSTSSMAFTVTLSKPSTESVTVGYTTSNGTATVAGSDYAPAVGTLTFAPGETSKTVNVTVNGDTLVELDEQFTLTLSAPVNATITDASGIGTIRNDDVDQAPATPPAVSIYDLTVVEGNGEHSHFMFMATLDKASTTPVTVAYATSNGTAIAGLDYSATSGTITFAPGVTSQLVHVDVVGDTTAEANETFTVTLSSPTGATIADGSAVGTITNDDVGAPTPGNSSASFVVSDNWGSGFTGAVTVTAGSSGLNGWTVEFDTPAQIGNIWNAEIVSRTGNHYVVRNVSYNAKVTAGQTVSFGFQATPGGASATATNFAVNGQPSSPATPPKISVADVSVAEGNSGTKNLVFVVSLDKTSTTPVTVAYATSNGTAAAGSDYTAKSGTVTFAPGVTSQQVTVVVAGDTVVESNETVTLTLSSPSGATIADGSAVGTITNDDVGAPTPGSSSASFVVSDNWGSGFTGAVTVTAGSSGLNGWTVEFDTPAQIGNIWNAEIVSRTGNHYVVRNVSYNAKVTAGQTVSFGFQATPGGASATATNFAVNGQPGSPATPPRISVADASAAESNSGTTQMTFVVSAGQDLDHPGHRHLRHVQRHRHRRGGLHRHIGHRDIRTRCAVPAGPGLRDR